MSTLVDWQIRRMALEGPAHGIEPYREEQLNPASYNLKVGTKGIIEIAPQRSWRGSNEAKTRQEIDLTRGFNLAPGGWILVDVEEFIKIPRNMEAQVILRSSAARRGWDHALAGFVDPGYQGRLTLEFVNCLKYEYLEIKTGMELVQLKLSKLEQQPERDYSQTGRYYGANMVEGCKDSNI